MTRSDAVARYGAIQGGVWVDSIKWCKLLVLPQMIQDRVRNSATGAPWAHVYCNKDMAPALLAALQNCILRGVLEELKTFDGCYMVRDVRGMPGLLSAHAYAMAIDLNAATNPLGGLPTFSAEFVKCFTDEGFVWGGTFPRCDGMHFSFAGW